MSSDTNEGSRLDGLERVDEAVRAPRPSLRSLLVSTGIASEEQLREAADEARQQGLRLRELVVARGWLDEQGLGRLLATQWRLPFLDREELTLDPVAAALLPVDQATALGGCVIGFHDDSPLVVVAEPTSERLNQLRERTGAATVAAPASFAVVSGSSLEGLLAELASTDASASPTSPQQPDQAVDTYNAHDVAHIENNPAPRSPEPNAAGEASVVEALLADLEQASTGLAILHERVEQLGAAGRATAQLAAELRYERDTAAEEAGRQHERVRHLEHLLEQERERARAFRQQLVDLLAETADSSPG